MLGRSHRSVASSGRPRGKKWRDKWRRRTTTACATCDKTETFSVRSSPLMLSFYFKVYLSSRASTYKCTIAINKVSSRKKRVTCELPNSFGGKTCAKQSFSCLSGRSITIKCHRHLVARRDNLPSALHLWTKNTRSGSISGTKSALPEYKKGRHREAMHVQTKCVQCFVQKVAVMNGERHTEASATWQQQKSVFACKVTSRRRRQQQQRKRQFNFQ